MRLLQGGSDREVAAIVSGNYPTVLPQLTITITITTSIATRRRKSVFRSWDGNKRPVKLIAESLRQDALAGEARPNCDGGFDASGVAFTW